MNTKVYHTLHPDSRAIREEVFVKEQGFSYEYDEHDDTAVHIVLYSEDSPVATCRVFELDSGVYMFGRLAVRKEYRKNGLGRIIMKEAEKNVILMGGNQIKLHAQLHAKDFYIKCGYTPFGEIDYEQDVAHIWMSKELKSGV